MTYFPDPYEHQQFTYDPLGRVPPSGPPMGPPPFAPVPPPRYPPYPPPAPYRPPVNTLATLSVVFAFVFAPVGALLGHLGLSQIRRSGELGRDRALLGVALSYAFIASTVVALVAWAVLGGAISGQSAAPTSTAAGPPPPTVAPDAIGALLPGLDALKNITTDQNLQAGRTWDHLRRSDEDGAIDRPDCWGSIAPGVPDAYSADPVVGYRAAEFSDTRSMLKSMQVIEAVAAFRDPPAARAQLARLLSGWRECGGSTVSVSIPNGETIPFVLGQTADAGNGVSTLNLAPRGLKVRCIRAIAVKANVVVDLYLSFSGTTDDERPKLPAASLANDILGKIPG